MRIMASNNIETICLMNKIEEQSTVYSSTTPIKFNVT